MDFSYFMLRVNTNYDNVVKILTRIFDGEDFKKQGAYAFSIKDYYIVLEKNDDYDEKLSGDLEEGYLYYQFSIGFYYENDTLIPENQINFSKQMKQAFEKSGVLQVEILADFESLL